MRKITGLLWSALLAALLAAGCSAPAPAVNRARTPVAVIAGHGVLAVTTILLVLLATIGAA